MNHDHLGMEYQKVIEYIFELIRDGKLHVGSRIPSERELSEITGVGRNSTREAISILRGFGLVKSIHGSGNYVVKECAETIRIIVSMLLALGSISNNDILYFRQSISEMVYLNLMEKGVSPAVAEKIEKILADMKNSSQEEFIRLDREFHLNLLLAVDNPLFYEILAPIAEVYLGMVRQVIEHADEERRGLFWQKHQRIYEGIKTGNKELCLQNTKEHYALAKQTITKE